MFTHFVRCWTTPENQQIKASSQENLSQNYGITITTFSPPIRDFAIKKFVVNVNMQVLYVVDYLLSHNFDTEICSRNIYNTSTTRYIAVKTL